VNCFMGSPLDMVQVVQDFIPCCEDHTLNSAVQPHNQISPGQPCTNKHLVDQFTLRTSEDIETWA
jgi:hypothetical protein